jgi:hypothetical protein
MTDHQFRQLLETLKGIDGSLAAIARAMTGATESTEEPTDTSLLDAIERGRLFNPD